MCQGQSPTPYTHYMQAVAGVSLTQLCSHTRSIVKIHLIQPQGQMRFLFSNTRCKPTANVPRISFVFPPELRQPGIHGQHDYLRFCFGD